MRISDWSSDVCSADLEDGPRVCIGVLDVYRCGSDLMLECVIFEAGETEGAGRIEAHGLEIAGDDFHRGDAAIRHRSEKAVTVGKGGARTPEAEPRGVAQIFGLRRTDRKSVV